jgi:hypothetical protein
MLGPNKTNKIFIVSHLLDEKACSGSGQSLKKILVLRTLDKNDNHMSD